MLVCGLPTCHYLWVSMALHGRYLYLCFQLFLPPTALVPSFLPVSTSFPLDRQLTLSLSSSLFGPFLPISLMWCPIKTQHYLLCKIVDDLHFGWLPAAHTHPHRVIIFRPKLENSSACFRRERCLLGFMGHFMLPFPLVGNMCHFYNTVKLKCWGEMLSDVSAICKRKRLA